MRVCQDWYPHGWHPKKRKAGFRLHIRLKAQLDLLLKNIVNDWDFTIIIAGGGEVRVGKSILAMQIAAYWAHEVQRLYKKKVIFNVENNIVMDGRQLIKTGNFLGRNYNYNPLVFDEAGADLEGRKAMTTMTKDVLDFYRECGQYNLLNVLVLPEFFDLPKGIAVSRSIFLINVNYIANEKGIFERGYFDFYSRKKKKWLYLKGKRELDYKCVPPNFNGTFDYFFTVDEEEYRELKRKALKNRESVRNERVFAQRDACMYLLCSELGWSYRRIAGRITNLSGYYTTHQTVKDANHKYGGQDSKEDDTFKKR